MAVTARANTTLPAVPAVNNPSVGTEWTLRLTFAGLPDISNFSIAVGRSAGPPATRVDLIGAVSADALTANSCQFSEVDGGASYSGMLTMTVSPSGGSPGDHVWVSIFELPMASVVDASVPALNIGPYVLVA